MARAPDQTRSEIHANAVRGALDVVRGDTLEDLTQSSSRGWARQQFEIGPQLFANQPEPQRGVGGVPVGSVLSENGVRERAVALEAGESQQELPDLFDPPGREQTPGGYKRVPAPVEKPGITGHHCFAGTAFDEKSARGT